jgi:hypothetical protein
VLLLCVLTLGVVSAACSPDDGVANTADPADGERSSTVVPAGDDLDDRVSVATDRQVDETGAVSRRTVRFDGVSFDYASPLADDVSPTRDRSTDSERPDGPPNLVRFEFERGEGAASALSRYLVVRSVRDPSGNPYPGVDPADLALVDSLIDRPVSTVDDDAEVRPVSFINGRGLRTIEGRGTQSDYLFRGATNDRRFLVELHYGGARSATGDPRTVAHLDDLVMTLYVDGGSAALDESGCSNDVTIESDAGVEDGAVVAAGAELNKSWVLRNTGDCTWNNGYSWVFTGGHPLRVLDITAFDDVEPGDDFEVVVTFVAPEEPGTYSAQWQLQVPNQFEPLRATGYVLIEVGNPDR